MLVLEEQHRDVGGGILERDIGAEAGKSKAANASLRRTA